MLGYQHELNATNQGMSYEKNVFGPAVSPAIRNSNSLSRC
jgi:hypothetical protein